MNLLRIFLLLLLESVFCLLSRLCRSPSKVASIGVYTSEYETRFKNLGNLYNGSDSLSRLASSHVCVIGLGGVGSWAVEALARSGVGEFTLVDADDVCTSNTNRQIQALTSTVGKMKATSLSDRILDINPEAKVTCIFDFIRKENIHKFVNSSKAFSVIVDATDSVSDKAAIINACVEYGLPVVTTGGVGGLIDPLSFEVSDLTDTRGDNLLMQVRKKLRQKYGYPSPGPKGGGPQTAKQRKIKPWNIPCVHTIPIGRSRGQPAAACGNEVSIETSSTKRLGSSFRKCDALFGNACFATGTAGFVLASLAVTMIAKDESSIPSVEVKQTAASLAYRLEIESNSKFSSTSMKSSPSAESTESTVFEILSS